MTSKKDTDTSFVACPEMEVEECVHGYLKASKNVLIIYATHNAVAAATSVVEAFEELPTQMTFSFAQELNVRTSNRVDAFGKQCEKSTFVDKLPLNIPDNIRRY